MHDALDWLDLRIPVNVWDMRNSLNVHWFG